VSSSLEFVWIKGIQTMASEKTPEHTEVNSTETELSFDFELDEEQQKAVIDCIRKNGKVSIKLGSPSISKLPGRGLLDDTEGKLID
jgi:hypothetical protein